MYSMLSCQQSIEYKCVRQEMYSVCHCASPHTACIETSEPSVTMNPHIHAYLLPALTCHCHTAVIPL